MRASDMTAASSPPLNTLSRPKRGRHRIPLNSLIEILEGDESYKGKFAFNSAKNQVVYMGQTIGDHDYTALNASILTRYRYGEIGSSLLASAVHHVSLQNAFNPITQYLNALKWDKVKRLSLLPASTLNVRCMGEPTSDSALKEVETDVSKLAIYGRYCEVWFTGAVARAFKPGCKVENVLAFDGPQGSYKSTFFSAISSGPGDDYFTDNKIDPTSRDGLDLLNGSWIVEWAEFEDVINGKSSGAVKAFLSTQTDRYRPAYARHRVTVPRRSVFCASTNVGEVFKDATGNRRFLIIPTGKIDIARARADKDQLWAEAVQLYRNGTPWHLTDSELAAQIEANMAFQIGAGLKADVASLTAGFTELGPGDIAMVKDTLSCTSRRLADLLRQLGFVSKLKRINGLPTRVYARNQP